MSCLSFYVCGKRFSERYLSVRVSYTNHKLSYQNVVFIGYSNMIGRFRDRVQNSCSRVCGRSIDKKRVRRYNTTARTGNLHEV